MQTGFDYSGALAIAGALGYDLPAIAEMLPDAVSGALSGIARHREQETDA